MECNLGIGILEVSQETARQQRLGTTAKRPHVPGVAAATKSLGGKQAPRAGPGLLHHNPHFHCNPRPHAAQWNLRSLKQAAFTALHGRIPNNLPSVRPPTIATPGLHALAHAVPSTWDAVPQSVGKKMTTHMPGLKHSDLKSTRNNSRHLHPPGPYPSSIHPPKPGLFRIRTNPG